MSRHRLWTIRSIGWVLATGLLILTGCADQGSNAAGTARSTGGAPATSVLPASCASAPRTLPAGSRPQRPYLPATVSAITVCKYHPAASGSALFRSAVVAGSQLSELRTQINAMDVSQQRLHCGNDDGAMAQLLVVGQTGRLDVIDVDLHGCQYESVSVATFGRSTPQLIDLLTAA
jgi:hypothetical protein